MICKTGFLFSAVILFLCTLLFGQAPVIEWQKCYGGSEGERPSSVIQLQDSSFIIAGATESNNGDVSGNHGWQDYWVTKIDKSGNIIWQKCYGGSIHDGATSIIETLDGGFAVCGQASSPNGDVTGNHSTIPFFDVWLVKLDSAGNLQWQKCLGGSGDESCYSFIQTADSGYALACWTTSNDGDVSGNHSIDTADCWLVILDSFGNIEWQRCYGGSLEDKAYAILESGYGGYFLMVNTLSNDGDITNNHDVSGIVGDIWILKLDSVGNILWQNCFGGSSHEIGYQFIKSPGDNLLIAGATLSNDGDVSGFHGPPGNYDCWIFEIDTLGNILWQKCYGGSDYEFGNAIINKSRSWIIGGSTRSNNGDVSGHHNTAHYDYWIFSTDSLGNLEWQLCLGGTNDEAFSTVINTLDGGLLACGYSVSNDGDVNGHHIPIYNPDYWFVKLSAPYMGVSDSKNFIKDFTCFLNPADNSLIVNVFSESHEKTQVQLLDIAGKLILQETFSINIGYNKKKVDPGRLNNGIYFVRLVSERGILLKKIIKIFEL